MRRVPVSLIAATLTAMALIQKPAASQSANPAPMPPGQVAAGGVIVAELSKSIDARKAKAGDKIEARVTMDVLSHGEIVIPRGTKILGHISAAKAQTKQAPGSMVEIAFDRLLLKKGREVPLQATIQAVARTQISAQGNEAGGDVATPPTVGPQSMAGRSTITRTLGSAFPGSLNPPSAGTGADEPANNGGSGKDSARSLEPTRQGVFGMKGIALSHTAQGSAISSTRENVHLSSGTQLVLRVAEPQVLADSLRRTKN